MALRKSFGRTWWGNAWIEAMERIDYNTNRLPRGRRYANNGSVRTIDIKEGEISAKVQGSRPKPYNIKINLKRFNNSQVKRITEIIESNPAIASDLSLGKLPEALLMLLSEHKVHLLPRSWDDIPAECSCPDWANPCKHLAAVYYIVANEIDKNPFLIFNLRGISTELLMKSSGLTTTHITEDKRGEADIFIPFDQIDIKNLSSNVVVGDLQSEISNLESNLPDLSFPSFDIESIFALLSLGTIFAFFTVPIATISILQRMANQTHHTRWKRTDIYFYKNNLTETRIAAII
ncbi:MAG: SWIM zinc finger family protein [Nitrospinae bacterium]|nr:SWIM zinc finger family protein [Nitrospinota bacterium]